VLKRPVSLKAQEVEARGREALVAVLSGVRGLRLVSDADPGRPTGTPSDPGYDFQEKVETQGGQLWWLFASAKSEGHPRHVRSAVWGLKRLGGRTDLGAPVYPLVIAPYLSEESIAICKDEDVGYLDLSGNCHLEFGGIHVHVEGKPNRYKETRGIQTLFSPKASRVVRVLLQGPLRPHKVEKLASAADVSLGLVSKVRQNLLEREWVAETEDGIVVRKPDALLDAWAEADDWSKRTEVREYSLLQNSPQEVASKVVSLLEGKKYAFTEWFGTFLRQPYTLPVLTTLYVKDFPDEEVLKQELGARRVVGGGRLRLVRPADEGVFHFLQVIQGRKVVCDVQLYLDVIAAGLRGDEAAEELRKAEDFSGGWK
jgi:hypothetical protein